MFNLTLDKKAKLLVRVPTVPGLRGFDVFRYCYTSKNHLGFDMSYWIVWSGEKPIRLSPTQAQWYLDTVSMQCKIRRGKQ